MTKEYCVLCVVEKKNTTFCACAQYRVCLTILRPKQARPEMSAPLESPITRDVIVSAFRDLAQPAEVSAFIDELSADVGGGLEARPRLN